MTGEPDVRRQRDRRQGRGAGGRVRDRGRAAQARARRRPGAVIEVPMAELLASFGLVEHLWGRAFVPPRGEARYPRVSSPVRRPFPTADGHLAAVVYSDRDWQRFFAMIGRPELADDPRYATLHDRTQHARGAVRASSPSTSRATRPRSGSSASPRPGSRRRRTTRSTTCSTTSTSSRSGCSKRSTTPPRAGCCSA